MVYGHGLRSQLKVMVEGHGLRVMMPMIEWQINVQMAQMLIAAHGYEPCMTLNLDVQSLPLPMT